MKRLSNFYLGTTKEFDVDVYYDGVLQNVTQDKVTLCLIDGDTEIEYQGDTTAGTNGRVSFIIEHNDKNLEAKQYDYKIMWKPSDKAYLLMKDKVKVLEA